MPAGMISRKDFYKEAKEAYAVIATTETPFMHVQYCKKAAFDKIQQKRKKNNISSKIADICIDNCYF